MAKQRGRIELHEPGIKALLKSDEVGRMTDTQGQQLSDYAARASINSGALYSVRTWTGRDRKRTHVATANPEAHEAEARERALTRAAYILRGRRR